MFNIRATIQLAKPTTDPIDKSIPAVIKTTVCPIAIIDHKEDCLRTFVILLVVAKVEVTKKTPTKAEVIKKTSAKVEATKKTPTKAEVTKKSSAKAEVTKKTSAKAEATNRVAKKTRTVKNSESKVKPSLTKKT